MRKRKKLIVLLVVNIIIFLVVGYAVLTSNLSVNGNFTFTNNNWDVHFENLEISEDSITAITEAQILDNDNTKINYSINLSKPGDSYVFFVDVVNSGTVDGMISNLTNNQLTTEQQKYLTYDVTYSSGSVINNNDAVNSQSKVRIKVSLSYKYDIDASLLPSTENNLNLSLSTDVVLATDNKNQSTAEKLRSLAVTSGDGLYKSSYEEGRYIYRGTDPNNYVSVDGELWRIISVEADGTLKIVRKEALFRKSFDVVSNKDGFCYQNNGCSAWAKTSSLLNTPEEFRIYYPNGNPEKDTRLLKGKVNDDSSLNKYLNSEYLNSSKIKKYSVPGIFNVGSPGNYLDKEDALTNINQEKVFKWCGKVGLITVMEFMQTNLTFENYTINNIFHEKKYDEFTSWLYFQNKETFWTITPSACGEACNYGVFAIGTESNVAVTQNYVRPVVYLDSSIKMAGTGTLDNPYVIS